MQGSLCLHRGVLYVGRQAKTADVRAYDLDGRELLGGFRFRDARSGRSVVAGIAVDDERRIWIADTPASRVRTFTLFGREIGGIGRRLDQPLGEGLEPDAAGRIAEPVDVVVRGDADHLLLIVALGGQRRHAVQVFDGLGRLASTLRPSGDPHGRFHGVRGIALCDRLLYVAEGRAGRIQVFRDGDFHFQFPCAVRGTRLEPSAIAALSDGRVIVACAGSRSALCLFDESGRLLRVLASEGSEEGRVFQPAGVVVEPGSGDRACRLAVIDRDGDRVQVFSLEGRCLGAIEERVG